ncbi:MAG: hypothetical protein II306_02595, partial [Clostridia bacterium]|nr:hypothetical protein [Clostridia bacterium]
MAYFLLFFIYSFIGFILETIFAFITRGVIENRKTMRRTHLLLFSLYSVCITLYNLHPKKAQSYNTRDYNNKSCVNFKSF